MADTNDLTEAIVENATSAASVSSREGSQSSHSLQDQIGADRYLASKRAARRGRSGLRILPLRGGPSG